MSTQYEHPAFPQPDDPACSLWRYLDVGKFVWFARWKRILMPAATQLGDPLEGTLPGGDLAWWQEQLQKSSPERRRVVAHNQRVIANFAAEFRGLYFVSCWTKNPDSPAMWRTYTASHEAVAITTSYDLLRRVLPSYVLLGLVRYISHRHDRVPTFNMLEYIMHKDVSFAFENEVRAVALQPARDEDGLSDFLEHLFEREDDAGFHVFAPPVDVSTLVCRVVLHPRASNAFTQDVSGLCAEHGLPLPEPSGVADYDAVQDRGGTAEFGRPRL